MTTWTKIGMNAANTPAAALWVATNTPDLPSMRSTQYIWLGLTVLIGISLGFHHFRTGIFSQPFFQLLLGQNLNVFLPQISSPSFHNTLGSACTIALLFGFFTTLNGSPPMLQK